MGVDRSVAGGAGVIHLYWPGHRKSMCGAEQRTDAQFTYCRQVEPTHVPYRRHWKEYCPACLRECEIGPQERGGNRAQPIVGAYIARLSEVSGSKEEPA